MKNTMDSTFINDTAQYILHVIRSSRDIYWSWGVDKLKACIYENMATLSFSVSGFKHQGYVMVSYNEGSDLFEFFLLDHQGKKIKHVDEIYVENLIQCIDRHVEKDCTDEEYNVLVNENHKSFCI